MKKTSILSLLILIGLTSFAQWQQIKSPAGTIEVQSLFNYNGKMFVMEPGSGLFTKSTSDSEWVNCNDTYLIGVPVDGFFYGTNGTEKFFKIDLNHPENQAEIFYTYPPLGYYPSFYPCIIKHCDGNLLVGSYGNGFSILGLDGSEITYNNGLAFSWSENSRKVNAIAFDEQYYYCNAENYSDTYGYAIYRCPKDLSESWQLMNEGLPDDWETNQLDCFDGRLFVAYGKQLYMSDDRAEHWDSLFTAPSDVTMLDQIEGVLFLGTKSDGLFQSLDNGLTWTHLGLQGQTTNKIIKHEENLFVGTNNGVFVQQDEDWVADNYGIASSCFSIMVILDNHIVGLESKSNKLFLLEDDRTWTDISPNINMKHVSSIKTGDDMLFVSYYSYDSSIGNDRDYLIYSSDKGLSWYSMELPSVFPSPSLSSHFKRLRYADGKLYVFENKIMAYTSDLGQTWTEISLPYPWYSPRNFNSVIRLGDRLYCSCDDQVEPILMRLENDQWVRMAANGIPNGIASIVRFGDKLVAFSFSDDCYLSNDGGENFIPLNDGYMPDVTKKMAFSYQGRLFVCNGFANQCIEGHHQIWRKFNGLSSENTIGLAVLDDSLFLAMNNHGLWRMSVEDLQYEYIQKGSEWYYEIENENGSTTFQHLEYASDTTINGKRPKIIIRSNTQYDRDTISTETTHEYVYEEDEKVYWWNKELEEFTVLYDFSSQEGEVWEIKVGTESVLVHVDGIETFEYDNRTYTKLIVSDEDNIFSGEIVIGVGHLTSLFPEKLMRKKHRYEVSGLRCYWIDETLDFQMGSMDCDEIFINIHNGLDEYKTNVVKVYPNPTNGILYVQTDAPSLSAEQEYHIINLIGQNLLQGTITAETQQIDISRLPAGMYFISVDKRMVKFVVK